MIDPDKITVKKIKAKENKILMEYDMEKGEHGEFTDEHAFNCNDQARPEFYDALKSLISHVCVICELPTTYKDGLKVQGVSFSYKEGVMGATITALKTLMKTHAPLVINTPHKPTETYSAGADDSNVLSRDTIDALELLIDEAKKYINGDRAQGLLFKEQAA